MTVKIKQQLVPKDKRKATYGTGNTKKKMVVHQTGNPRKGANAKMHADLQSRGYNVASWHVQSDDMEIIQSWPYNYRLFHASTGRRANGGNYEGIGWEITINSDADYLKTLEVAAPGIAQVMKQEGIPMSGLVTHRDEDPQSQWCPAQILSGLEGVNWSIFKRMVQKAYDGNPVKLSPLPKPTTKPTASKSVDILAKEVIDGKWGVNPRRRNDLIAAGYNYNAIQNKVNQLAKAGTSNRSIESVAQEIAAGKGNWGNGTTRMNKLKAAGYNAQSVQNRVNAIIRQRDGVQARPSPLKAKKLYLPRGASSWRIYRPNGPYVANGRGQLPNRLAPAKYGGLTYTIKGNPAPHVYLIDTSDFGRVAIYAHPNTGATIR